MTEARAHGKSDGGGARFDFVVRYSSYSCYPSLTPPLAGVASEVFANFTNSNAAARPRMPNPLMPVVFANMCHS